MKPFLHSKLIQRAIYLLLVISVLCLKSSDYMDRARENFGLRIIGKINGFVASPPSKIMKGLAPSQEEITSQITSQID